MTRDTEPYRTSYDWRSESLTATIVEAIADFGAVGPTEFRLADYVDPDALNTLFRPRVDGSPRVDGRVSFAVEGYRVVVHADGEIVVHQETDDGDE